MISLVWNIFLRLGASDGPLLFRLHFKLATRDHSLQTDLAMFLI